MALNLGASGDFLPFMSYNAKAGRFFFKSKEGETELTNPSFIADLETIKTGWLYYKEGVAPERVWDKSLSEAAAKPARTYTDKDGKVIDCFKRGFEVILFSPKLFGGAAEFSSSSAIVGGAINDLYVQYEAQKVANAGKVPVVAVKGTEAIKGAYGTNYKPLFAIEKWVDAPEGLRTGASSPPTAQSPAPVAAAPVESEF